MALKNQQFFQQPLNGVTSSDVVRQLSYESNKLEDRLKEVKEIMENEQFFVEYISNYFRADINAGDHLSESLSVFTDLERFASYILNSKEIKEEEDENVTKYKFFTSRKYFEEVVNRESTTTGEVDDVTIAFMKTANRNYKASKELQITKKDRDDEGPLGEIIRDYLDILENFINVELRKFRHDYEGERSKFRRIFLTTMKGQVTDSMIIAKRSYSGVWGENLKNAHESTCPDYDRVDLSNYKHLYGFEYEEEHPYNPGQMVTKRIDGLLFLQNNHFPGTDMYLNYMMLDELIEKAPLVGKQREVIELVRLNYPTALIAETLEMESQNVDRTIKSAAKRIAKHAIVMRYGNEEE